MKKLFFSIIFILAFVPSFCQMATTPTPAEYGVNSGREFCEAEYMMHRYWYVMHLENGKSVYCHKLRCTEQGDNYEAVFLIKEIHTGKIIEKTIYYKNEEVQSTSVLR